MDSLNLNKLLNQFLDWNITFILYCGNALLTDLYKFKENVLNNGRTINNSILGTIRCQYSGKNKRFVT